MSSNLDRAAMFLDFYPNAPQMVDFALQKLQETPKPKTAIEEVLLPTAVRFQLIESGLMENVPEHQREIASMLAVREAERVQFDLDLMNDSFFTAESLNER